MPKGFIIGDKGPALFTEDADMLYILIAIINSHLSMNILGITSPTIMFEVKQLASMPIPQIKSSSQKTLLIRTFVRQSLS
jgi:hypothetical protein